MSLIYRNPLTGGSLYQSGFHEIPQIIKDYKIDTIILAAKELQPKSINGIELIRAGFEDRQDLTDSELSKTIQIADKAAEAAALRIIAGKSVLSTCRAGINRSGLISAMTLIKLLNLDGKSAISMVRSGRGNIALSNPLFREIIKAV